MSFNHAGHAGHAGPARIFRTLLWSAVLIGFPYHGALAEAGSAIQTGPGGKTVLARTIGTSPIDMYVATNGLVKEAGATGAMSPQSAKDESKRAAALAIEWRKPAFLGIGTARRAVSKDLQASPAKDLQDGVKLTLTGRPGTSTKNPKVTTR